MTLPIRFSDEAEADFVDASTWYALRREGLDQDFIECIGESIERIKRFPQTWGEAFPEFDACPFAVFRIQSIT